MNFGRDVELRSCSHITHASGTDLPMTIRPSSGHRAFPHVWFIAWFTTQCCSVPHLPDAIGHVIISDCESGSSVGIATELRAGRSGIESRWGRDFPPVQTGPGAHPAPCKMGTGSFPGVKCGRGVLLITHSLLVPRPWKSRAIPLPNLWATPGL